MNKLIHYSFGLLLLLGLAACATSPRESAANEAQEESSVSTGELEAQLTADRLPQKQLDALEERAQQKLSDLVDYMNLVNDLTLDSTFRAQAGEQAHQLFLQPGNMVAWMEELTLMTDSVRQTSVKKEATHYTIHEISIIEPLRQVSEREYRGTLSFRQGIATNHTNMSQQRQVDVWVKKVAKQFGNEQEMVWEVFLGAVE